MSPSELETRLRHEFSDRRLLDIAVTHRSYASEHQGEEHNERLEFLGDAVLQLIVTEYLYATQPGLREGEMAKVRAACVNRSALASIARSIGLGRALRLGVGEKQSKGAEKSSILADGMEALIAGVYLDGGMDAARRVVLDHWRDTIDDKAETPGRRDYKTRLQERLASIGLRPEYVMTETGPDHARTFRAEVHVDGRCIGSGVGASKKKAQQGAAREALASQALPNERNA